MRLIHDREQNALRLELGDGWPRPASREHIPGVVDVAAGGRLVGVELRTGEPEARLRQWLRNWTSDPVAGELLTIDPDGSVYFELTTGDPGDDVRSTGLSVVVETGEGGEMLAVSIPRRGTGFEISYPSGNR